MENSQKRSVIVSIYIKTNGCMSGVPPGHFFHNWSLKVTFFEKIRPKIVEEPDEKEKKHTKNIISSY